MAYVAFEPDPDYSEYEFGYGNFVDDKGERRYGYDPQLAQSLKVVPPRLQELMGGAQKADQDASQQRTAMNDDQLASVDRSPDRSQPISPVAPDVPASLDTKYQDLAPRGSQPAQTPSPVDGMPISPHGDQRVQDLAGIPGIDKTSPAFQSELIKTAGEMGVSPRAMAGIMSFESGFDPHIQSGGDAGHDAHAGLIQFSRANFGDVAKQAGQPEMSWDQMRTLSPEQQLPFVKAYYQLHGVKAGDTGGDLYMQTFAPAFKDKPDDAVLYDKDTSRGVAVNDSNRRLDLNGDGVINGYEQNPGGLDENHDGKITAGEVRARGNRYGEGAPGQAGAGPNMSLDDPSLANQSLDYRGGDQLSRMGQGAPGQLDPQQPLGQPMAGQRPGQPGMNPNDPSGQLGGLVPAKLEMHGTPLTPEQERERAGAIGQDLQARQQAAAAGADMRVEARNKMIQEYNDVASAKRTDAMLRQEHAIKAQAQAQDEIGKLVAQPITKVKPRALFGNSSFGNSILGTIAVALGQFGASVSGGPNMALQQLNKQVDDDIDVQKDAIRQGETSTRNRLAYWTDRLGSSQAGETAARAEMMEAAKQQAVASQLAFDNADTKAALGEFTAGLEQQKTAALNSLVDDRRNRLITDYAPPKVPLVGPQSAGPGSPLWHDEGLRQRAAQEFMTLKPGEQHKQLTALNTDMQGAESFKRAVTELADAYGGAFDKDGRLIDKGPVTSQDGKREDVHFDEGFAGVGTNLNPGNWINTRRDDLIEKKWGAIAGMRRMQFKTEPNSAKWQEILTTLDKPVSDSGTRQALERLYQQSQEMDASVQGSASPQALAYMSYQNPAIMGKMRAKGQRVTGFVGGGQSPYGSGDTE